MDKKIFKDNLVKLSALTNELFDQSVAYLKELAESVGGRITIREVVDVFEEAEDLACMSVTYDGGNHPEYASNAFSTVYAIFVENGKLYLEIEDCEMYYTSECYLNEIIYMADLVMDFENEIIETYKVD